MVDAGIEVKVEDYDGTYVCLFCGESVRGQPALKCSHCSSNPFHLACVALAHSKYAEVHMDSRARTGSRVRGHWGVGYKFIGGCRKCHPASWEGPVARYWMGEAHHCPLRGGLCACVRTRCASGNYGK